MTHEEIKNEVDELINADLYVLFNGSFFNTEHPIGLINSNEIADSKRLIIWIKNDIIPPECSRKATENHKDKFIFDYYFDPIIEFDIASINNNIILPNRLFYKTGWIKDDKLREIHNKATNKLVQTIKNKLSTSDKIKPFYISNGTSDLFNNGFEIELGIGGKRINEKTINGT